MSDEIGIRPATSADLPALVGLVRDYRDFEGIEGFEPARVSALLRALLETPVHGRIGRDNGAAREFYQRQGYRDREGFDIIDKTL